MPRRDESETQALTTSTDPLVLRSAVGDLRLSAGQRFAIIPDADGGWRVGTRQYVYSIDVAEAAQQRYELLNWHWHPPEMPLPHIHVRGDHPQLGDLENYHLPSGRVSFEQVIRLLIADFQVRPLREDWEDVLSEAEARFL